MESRTTCKYSSPDAPAPPPLFESPYLLVIHTEVFEGEQRYLGFALKYTREKLAKCWGRGQGGQMLMTDIMGLDSWRFMRLFFLLLHNFGLFQKKNIS
jgi:hypothetical protein